MRAVNLIPVELRRGGGAGAAGRSGGAVYIVIGALVALVAMALAYGVTTHKIAQRKTDIANVAREAQVAEARAAALQPYVQVQARKANRVSLVSGIASKRFDWSVAMRQVAQALPSYVVLDQLTGTDSPTSQTGGGGVGPAGSLRDSLTVPAVTLEGCAATQAQVAGALDALRTIPGVTVDGLYLSDTTQTTNNGKAAKACHSGPTFQVVVFYTNATARKAPQAGAAGTSVPAAAAAGAAPGATPGTPPGTAPAATPATTGPTTGVSR